MPQVSVVIPTFNRANLLPTAIRSVLNQTFQDFEILLVDDGSSDTTPEIVKSFDDARLQYIRHAEPRGGAAARNTGILHSSGEYVAFLDDDDEWYPHKLSRQMEVMLRSEPKVAAVYSGYVMVERATGRICGRKTPNSKGNLSAELLASNPIGGTSCMLVRKKCLEKIGLFDENLPSFQDRDLWIRISREFHFDYVAEPLLNYYVHAKKVWTNFDALLQGLEIMLAKYGTAVAFRKASSDRYLFCGVNLCEVNEFDKGRRALRRAVALNPYAVKPYFYLLVALLGPRTMAAVRSRKLKLFGRPGLSNSRLKEI
jgi:glycosyltransferase involved in cell wall biosynthesis